MKLSTSSGGHRAERDLRRTRRARVRAHRRQGSWACIVAGAALCATFISGASAAQTLRFTFTGRGWGHGVGMSQYGAEGDAAHGWSAAKILAWYYRGTTLAKVGRQHDAIAAVPGVSRAPVVDLMDALKKSLAKPAAAERRPALRAVPKPSVMLKKPRKVG